MAEHDHLTSPNLGGLDKFASEPEKVDKPWGHELIWAVSDSYAGKILFIKAGESMSYLVDLSRSARHSIRSHSFCANMSILREC